MKKNNSTGFIYYNEQKVIASESMKNISTTIAINYIFNKLKG